MILKENHLGPYLLQWQLLDFAFPPTFAFALCAYWYSMTGKSPIFWKALLISTVTSLAYEGFQFFIKINSRDLKDIFAGCLGSAVYMALIIMIDRNYKPFKDSKKPF